MWKKLKTIFDALLSVFKFFKEVIVFIIDILKQFPKLILTHLICVGIGAGVIYFKTSAPQFPEIVKVVEYKTQYKVVPATCPEYISCYQSPINITGKVDGEWLKVFAQDDCKQNQKDFKLEIKRNNKYIYYAACAGLIAGGAAVFLLK